MSPEQRELFDGCLDRVLAGLPARITELLEEVVVIVDDAPTRELLADLEGEDIEDPESLLGLHSGVPITEQSVEDHGIQPPTIHLFRRGLLAVAVKEQGVDAEELERQIRITLLHEIGHHFGLDEDDLDELGYG